MSQIIHLENKQHSECLLGKVFFLKYFSQKFKQSQNSNLIGKYQRENIFLLWILIPSCLFHHSQHSCQFCAVFVPVKNANFDEVTYMNKDKHMIFRNKP